MIVLVPSQLIELHHLPLHIHDQKNGEEALTLKQRVEKFEQRIVKDVIKKHPSLRIAAKELGIDHSTLVKKLKRWGLDPKKANI
ncbi:TyrR/PhhR family helix-turn-helix DNA-binding protein [Aeribacillus composti]|uniref:TyrR/PhhR family helix-turn-helix DNA-binding protein n=1 Tax=Aeribacillus composti TaxID=1868734 RepID=UPI00119A6E93|nr:TyrR/PhhR family helix-turn-helix DNA-binding protein [Aeribacillus composti]TVZ80620.1 TyrR family helix-turn-helix protein [Aeribacillus composti]